MSSKKEMHGKIANFFSLNSATQKYNNNRLIEIVKIK